MAARRTPLAHPAELLVGVGIDRGDGQEAPRRLAELLELGDERLAVAAPGGEELDDVEAALDVLLEGVLSGGGGGRAGFKAVSGGLNVAVGGGVSSDDGGGEPRVSAPG